MTDDMQTTDSEHIAGNRRIFARAFLAMFVALLVVFAYWVGRNHDVVAADTAVALSDARVVGTVGDASHTVDFGMFWDVWDVLRERYVDREHLDARKLLRGAIDGMLAATDDPYTMFFDAEELTAFHDDLEGTFDGIGAEIGMRSKVLTVIAPLAGSPAQRAGLRAGDMIAKIDGTETRDMSVDEAVRRMRGPRDTSVTLTVVREGAEAPLDIVIVRDTIEIKSVESRMDGEDVGIITVNRFGDDTPALFAAAGRDLRRQGMRALLVDLRNNPGGFLDSAIGAAGSILPRGSIVVISRDEHGTEEPLATETEGFLGDLPIAVLINGGSASASEILAGALKDHLDDRVRLFGEKSFGKGSVQDMVDLRDGAALKVTIAEWLTPDRREINHVGLEPDEKVEIAEEDFDAGRDPQKDAALRYLRERI